MKISFNFSTEVRGIELIPEDALETHLLQEMMEANKKGSLITLTKVAETECFQIDLKVKG